jgi:transcriptional regulator with XRE-family HTH domain
MTPDDFHLWRKSLGLTQAKAAEALGLGKRAIEHYDTGKRPDGQPVTIPRHIALACAAIAAGLQPWPHHKDPT